MTGAERRGGKVKVGDKELVREVGESLFEDPLPDGSPITLDTVVMSDSNCFG